MCILDQSEFVHIKAKRSRAVGASTSHLLAMYLDLEVVGEGELGLDVDVLEKLDAVVLAVVLELELELLPVEIHFVLALEQTLVVEEGGEGVDDDGGRFAAHFVAEGEPHRELRAVRLLHFHI